MKEAASYLIGTHDFKSFCANRHMKKSTVRTIFDISIEEQDGILRIRYHGDGFLYNMVRILTGTLIEVGTGNRAPFQIPMILDGLDRSLAGFTAPAERTVSCRCFLSGYSSGSLILYQLQKGVPLNYETGLF